ncbi:hypothetical protein F383_14327 [Gossypium arboreum]|uniref:Uncharacterized protein n=1 Tax=Gossypium arboreum TaxID=29729 RepID=A0A0B0NG62_GOSAR|nr:hypothetical protein F383_14327 [Gossypium arboreum]
MEGIARGKVNNAKEPHLAISVKGRGETSGCASANVAKEWHRSFQR